jgi:outer membrane protein assembly factor BamB
MKTSELVFVGIKGSVIALNRFSGQQEWATHLKGGEFVNVILESDVLLASCCGEIYCLNPQTGQGLWHNPLKGFGRGLATIVTEQNPRNKTPVVSAEKHCRDQEAAAPAVAAAS